jgi:hypothetical protein
MTQPAQGQGPPTIPKSGEISPMSGPEPETTTTVEGRTLILIRTCRCAFAPWQALHGSARASSLTYTHCFALVQARLEEAEELKQEGNDLFRRSKWNEALQSYRNGLARLPKRNFQNTHHQHRRHRHGLQLPTTKEIHPWLKGRFLVPPQMPKVKANPPIVSTSILHWSTNVQKCGAFSMRISRRAT